MWQQCHCFFWTPPCACHPGSCLMRLSTETDTHPRPAARFAHQDWRGLRSGASAVGPAPNGRGRVPSPSLVPSESSPRAPQASWADEGGIRTPEGQGPAPSRTGWYGHRGPLLMSTPLSLPQPLSPKPVRVRLPPEVAGGLPAGQPHRDQRGALQQPPAAGQQAHQPGQEQEVPLLR